MTQYEKLSLSLLSYIATGIAFILADKPQSERVSRWLESLEEVLERVAKATKEE